jgi:hypothetical protein
MQYQVIVNLRSSKNKEPVGLLLKTSLKPDQNGQHGYVSIQKTYFEQKGYQGVTRY